MANDIVQYSVSDMERLAKAIAASKLFGVQNPEQALALMAIAQAEGLHPAIAARDYHIIQGRPTLKADAMMARFQTAGGKVEWHEYSDEACEATFTHSQGGTVRVKWDMQRALKAELFKMDNGKKLQYTKDGWKTGNWEKYTRAMLRSRVISEGIRTIFPGVLVGTYTPDEVEEFEQPKSAMAKWAETPPPVIEHEKPKDVDMDKLIGAAKEFERRLNAATSPLQVTNLVANNNSLMLALHENAPETYESLGKLISSVKEAFELAQAAE